MTENKNRKIITLEKIIGNSIDFNPVKMNSNLMSRELQNNLTVYSDELYAGLVNFFDVRPSFFQTSISVDRLVQYKDGSVSSMIKGTKGIEGHAGFDIVDTLQLANEIFIHVGNAFNKAIFNIFEPIVAGVNSNISNIYIQFQLQDFAQLKSISFFLQEIYQDLVEMGFSKEQSLATLTNIQKCRIDLRELLYKYHEMIRSNISPFHEIMPMDLLSSNYVSCRFCKSLYIISLVMETILSNRLDDEGVKSLRKKVEDSITEFNSLTSEVFTALKNRFDYNESKINNIFDWSMNEIRRTQKYYENQSLNNFAHKEIAFIDPQIEIQKIDEILKSRPKLLTSIKVRPEK